MKRILIVEDEREIAEIERDYLEINGMEADIIGDGLEALAALQKQLYDLVLLDVMLPGKNGYEICREIREQIRVPILMVTARTEPVDRIRGLGLGADDYILKPFDPAELVARVKSHLARYDRLTSLAAPAPEAVGGEGKQEEALVYGSLKILPKAYKAYKDGRELRLATREFELLLFLSRNPNIVFTKEKLFEQVWGYEYVGDASTVTVHINRIRDKIEDDRTNPKFIETVWGAGYRFNKVR